MEEHNPTPHHLHRLALKPHLPPEVTSGRRRRSRSAESSTCCTSAETSSFQMELAQEIYTQPGSSIIFETKSS